MVILRGCYDDAQGDRDAVLHRWSNPGAGYADSTEIGVEAGRVEGLAVTLMMVGSERCSGHFDDVFDEGTLMALREDL